MPKRRRLFTAKQRTALDFAFEDMDQNRLREERYVVGWYGYDKSLDRKEVRVLVDEHLRRASVKDTE